GSTAGAAQRGLARLAGACARARRPVRARDQEGRSQRALSLRLGEEVQALSRRAGARRLSGIRAPSIVVEAAPIHVVAGALFDAEGRVLIAQRPAGKHMAGGWEFPGGKLEAGEPARVGLGRELREELGVEVLQAEPLVAYVHAYTDRR